jgi:hypothetical protein
MESEPLNTPSNEDEKLAALLRRSTPVLPDEGFSMRVLASLPTKTKPTKVPSLALLLSTVGGIVGLIVALARGATFNGAGDAVFNHFADGLSLLASPWLIFATGLTVFCLFLSYLLMEITSARS